MRLRECRSRRSAWSAACHRSGASRDGRCGSASAARCPPSPLPRASGWPRRRTGLRHAEDAGHHGDREIGLVGSHEPEGPDGRTLVFRANQAVARERMSRSSFNYRFSHHNRTSSARSVAVRRGLPSAAWPRGGPRRGQPPRASSGWSGRAGSRTSGSRSSGRE